MEVIGLSGCRLGTKGIITISEVLCKIETLTILNIQNNGIRREACDAIESAILSNCQLEELYIGGNRLELGAAKVAVALTNISTLRVLDLSENQIPDVVAVEIASAIMSNCFLQDLWVYGNRLTMSGIKRIASPLCKIATLKSFEIQNNLITEEIAVALRSSVLNNDDAKLDSEEQP